MDPKLNQVLVDYLSALKNNLETELPLALKEYAAAAVVTNIFEIFTLILIGIVISFVARWCFNQIQCKKQDDDAILYGFGGLLCCILLVVICVEICSDIQTIIRAHYYPRVYILDTLLHLAKK